MKLYPLLYPSQDHGTARLAAEGICAADQLPGGRWQIAMDLYLIGFPGTAPNAGSLSRSPRVPARHFEIRPDLPYSLIGRDIWQEFQIALGAVAPPYSLPPYATAPHYLRSNYVLDRGGRLPLLRVAVAHPTQFPLFIEPKWWFRTDVGLRDDLPASTCILGREIFRHGAFCWADGHSYFFPGPGTGEIRRQRTCPNATPI